MKSNMRKHLDFYYNKNKNLHKISHKTIFLYYVISYKIIINVHDTEIIISDKLNGQQERNLQDYFECRIFDRTRLILAIFEKAAISAAGKLQVEIAQLELLKTRLAGHKIHLEQQAGSNGV